MGLYEETLANIERKNTNRTALIHEYLVSGNPAALAGITPLAQGEYVYIYTDKLKECLPRPDALDTQTRRIIHVLFKMNDEKLPQWLQAVLDTERPGEDLFAPVRATLLEAGFEEAEIRKMVLVQTYHYETGGQPNSLGRYLLALDEPTLRQASVVALCKGWSASYFAALFVKHDAARAKRVFYEEWKHEKLLASIRYGLESLCRSLMQHSPDDYAAFTDFCFRSVKTAEERYEVGRLLLRHNPEKYREEVIAAGVESILGDHSFLSRFRDALLAVGEFGLAAWPMMETAMRDGWEPKEWWYIDEDKRLLALCVEKLERKDAVAVLKLAFKSEPSMPQVIALEHIVKLHQGEEDALIESTLKELIKGKSLPVVARAVRLAGVWNIARIAEPVWAVMSHKSNPVRQAAARALAGLGEAALPRATKLLADKKSDARLAAAALLELVGTPRAIETLEARLDAEESETVRDAIFRALDAAWTAQGREVPMDEIRRRIARAKDKMGAPPARWADAALLPPVYLRDGTALDRDAVQYLIYRQSRNKEIVADVEAKALYRLIDRPRSHDFAQAVLQAFLAYQPIAWDEIKAKNIPLYTLLHDKAGNYFYPNAPAEERWALALAALTGDDRLVKLLVKQVIEWTAPADGTAARGPMAVYGVQALKLLGSDAALMALDSLAFRFRAKWKNVGAAATAALAQEAGERGITLDELGDSTVPWLGFEPGRPRLIEHGGTRIEVTVGPDLKFQLRDPATGKPIKALPKTLPEEIQQEFKTQGEVLREAIKAQTPRLENLMVRQQRWPLARWRELFLGHPILRPYGVRLVWGAYDGEGALLKAFRPLEDGTMTDEEDEAVTFEDAGAACTIGILHPLELEDAARRRWLAHLADYEIKPPFAQLERPVRLVTPEETGAKTFKIAENSTVSGGTFSGRAGRLGWGRGPDEERSIPFFYKSFPLAGIDFMLFVGGYYLGMDPGENVTLSHGLFVRAGSINFKFCEFPEDEKDERVLALGAVPPIVFSEIAGDLEKIGAGKKESE